jgi:hypothetical protein
VSRDEPIGAFVRSRPVPRQTNDPDITVVSLDLHENGFVVRCEVGEGERLQPGGLVALDLRDNLGTPYERAGHGENFIAYVPTIPTEAEWVKVGTTPETHIDLRGSR